MKHTIMCSCGKLAIKCKEASEGLNDIVINAKKETTKEITSILENWNCQFNDTIKKTIKTILLRIDALTESKQQVNVK